MSTLTRLVAGKLTATPEKHYWREGERQRAIWPQSFVAQALAEGRLAQAREFLDHLENRRYYR